MRLIDADALMNYCNNLKDKTVDANDIARFPTACGWISVKDRLPENDNNILAFLNDGVETRIAPCNYANGVWYDCVMNCVVVIHYITHWMPVPEPPKEETDGHNSV